MKPILKVFSLFTSDLRARYLSHLYWKSKVKDPDWFDIVLIKTWHSIKNPIKINLIRWSTSVGSSNEGDAERLLIGLLSRLYRSSVAGSESFQRILCKLWISDAFQIPFVHFQSLSPSIGSYFWKQSRLGCRGYRRGFDEWRCFKNKTNKKFRDEFAFNSTLMERLLAKGFYGRSPTCCIVASLLRLNRTNLKPS